MKKIAIIIVSLALLGCNTPGTIEAKIKVFYLSGTVDTVKVERTTYDLPRVSSISLNERACLLLKYFEKTEVLACGVRRFEVIEYHNWVRSER